MHTIVISKQDIAGMTILPFLLNKHSFKETSRKFDNNPVYKKGNFQLVIINEFQVYADYLDPLQTDLLGKGLRKSVAAATDLFIFASRHTGKKPALTAHPIGNFSKAELGGKDLTVYKTDAFIMKNYLLGLSKLNSERQLGLDVTLEATHHGPHLSKPAIFIEFGGPDEAAWHNQSAAEAVADTIMYNTSPVGKRIALGFGDMHYPYYFTKLCLNSDIAFSHMMPQHALQFLTEAMLQQLLSATPKVDLFVCDWKNMGGKQTKDIVTALLEKTGIPIQKAAKL